MQDDVGTTVGRIAERVGGILRDSTDLVRVTVRDEVQSVVKKVVSLLVAGVAAFIGLLLFANGLAIWLSRPLGRAGGFVVVGLAFLIISGIVVFATGRSGEGKKHER